MPTQVLSVEAFDKKNAATILILSEDGEKHKYIISTSRYRAIGAPLRGDLIDDSTLDVIAKEDEERRALLKAMGILAYADNNIFNLRRKLRIAGFSSEATEEAIKEVLRLGYVNEEKQLLIKIKDLANRSYYGPFRIGAKLHARGYSYSLINKCISILTNSGEVDFDEIKEMLLKKHCPKSFEEKQKLLYKHGFIN